MTVPAQKKIRIIRVRDMVHVGQRDPSLGQAVVDRMERQLPRRERHRPLGMLAVREPLFLRGGDDDSVSHEARGGIMIDGIDPKSEHYFISLNSTAWLASPRPRALQIPGLAMDAP